MGRVTSIDLRKAFARGDFQVVYQPIVDIETKQPCCCEALLRWLHPEHGPVAPDVFIPVAEASGVIVPLGSWVLRQACTEAKQWPEHVRVAVNVSTVQLRDPGLVESVTSALQLSQLPADRLEIEVTESILSGEDNDVLQVLRRLQELGVKIALDDFGTGYSALSYLRRFAFDKVKIDRSFVQSLSGDVVFARSMIRAVARLATALGARTTAEGVETEAEWTMVREEGCTEVQGYLISRPKTAAETISFLQNPANPSGRESRACVSPARVAVDPTREEDRLRVLYDYHVLDTDPEDAFDRITRLAARVLETPTAIISLVDRDRQWFKSSVGIALKETPRHFSFCTHTIRGHGPLLVSDALLDDRFRTNPLVVGPPHIRAYAGMPLRSASGHNVGALCVNDVKPRTFSRDQIDLLRDLARLAVDELELRRWHGNDVLTGALNADAFKTEANAEIASARSHSRPLTCVLLDIPDLSALNEEFGYSVGDALVVKLGAFCLRELDARCIFGRLTSSTFATLLLGTGESEAREVVSRLSARFATLLGELAPKNRIAARFGVAPLRASIANATDLLKHAKKDLAYVPSALVG
ncbi:MAG TPA: EAL domain-containing protein [Hyphomicrobiaceae bacterium]|nr:EAL domain-containing protein [Hyphomicrobiaceae bacterium]